MSLEGELLQFRNEGVLLESIPLHTLEGVNIQEDSLVLLTSHGLARYHGEKSALSTIGAALKNYIKHPSNQTSENTERLIYFGKASRRKGLFQRDIGGIHLTEKLGFLMRISSKMILNKSPLLVRVAASLPLLNLS